MFRFILLQSNKYSINAQYLHDFYTTKKKSDKSITKDAVFASNFGAGSAYDDGDHPCWLRFLSI